MSAQNSLLDLHKGSRGSAN